MKKQGLKPDVAGELKGYLTETGQVVAISNTYLIHREIWDEAVNRLKENLLADEPFSPTQAKDILNISRKYLIPFLETLDSLGHTQRMENQRAWRHKP